MKTIENLKDDYLRIANWHSQFRKMLTDFLNNALAACKDGVEVLDFKYKTYEEADASGEEFYDQFPICITIVDKHGFNHDIYVTKLYKKNDLFFVDGYDSSDGEWIEGWYTDNSNDTYDSLCYFLGDVLGMVVEEAAAPQVAENHEEQPSVLVGYQLVDTDNSFPSEFGCWDVFRTQEDAEIYRQEEMLNPDEWRIIEEWGSKNVSLKYHFHEIKERTFSKGEKVLVILPMGSSFAFVREDCTAKSGVFRVPANQIDSNDEWVQIAPFNGHIYQSDNSLICPKCGKPMYSAWRTNLSSHCPECEGICKD